MNRTCLVIPFYLGERRNVPDKYNEDKLIYLKEQIESLEEVNHHLSKVVFIFNLEPGHEDILEGYKDKIPKKIQSADVEIVLRENKGFSYAACTEYITQNIDEYDYFLFTEDDCLFVAEEFDKNLIELFNKYDNCGFLGAIVRDPAPWNNFKKHAGHGTGMMSRDSIKRVWDKFIKLSKSNITDYKTGEAMQITFSHCFVEEGMEIYDVRSKYRVPFSTVGPNLDIIYFFSYNNEDLVIPSEIHNNGWFVWNNADATEFNNYD